MLKHTRLCKLFFIVAIVTALIAGALTVFTALLTVRTANTVISTFFGSVKVKTDTCNDQYDNGNYNKINHNYLILSSFFLLALRASSSLSFLLVLMIRNTTTAIITMIAARPAIAAPMPSFEGSTIRVPTV